MTYTSGGINHRGKPHSIQATPKTKTLTCVCRSSTGKLPKEVIGIHQGFEAEDPHRFSRVGEVEAAFRDGLV